MYQIPGAMYCLKQQVLLKDSSVLSTDKRIDYQCADFDVCNEHVEEDPYPLEIKKFNLNYIKNAENLMF
jgi:hypothetical protein